MWLQPLLAVPATVLVMLVAETVGILTDRLVTQVVVVPLAALVWAVVAELVAPHPARTRWWVLRLVAVVVVLALVSARMAVLEAREEAEFTAEFKAKRVPLLLVELPGYRTEYRRPPAKDPDPDTLALYLVPAGSRDETGKVQAIVELRTKVEVGCDSLREMELPMVAGPLYRRLCEAAGPAAWAFDHPRQPIVVHVRDDTLVVLIAPYDEGVRVDDLLAARIRPTTVRELVRIADG